MVATKKNKEAQPKLIVRNTQHGDIEAIQTLSRKIYPDIPCYSAAEIKAQIQKFPEGQFVVLFEETVVGFCTTCRLSEELAFSKHDWGSITGNGYASRHDPEGEWLYGIEVQVDPDMHGNRIGQRLYNERKNLCLNLSLKGIVFGGRLPNLAKRWKKVGSAEKYIELVQSKKLRDPVLGFQLRNGFEPIGVCLNISHWIMNRWVMPLIWFGAILNMLTIRLTKPANNAGARLKRFVFPSCNINNAS